MAGRREEPGGSRVVGVGGRMPHGVSLRRGRGVLSGRRLLSCRVEPKTVVEAERRIVGRVMCRRGSGAGVCVCVCMRARALNQVQAGMQRGKAPRLWLGPLGPEWSSLTKFLFFTSQNENCELHMKSTPW